MTFFDDPSKFIQLIKPAKFGRPYWEPLHQFPYMIDGEACAAHVSISEIMTITCHCEDGQTRYLSRQCVTFGIPGILRFDCHFDSSTNLYQYTAESADIDYTGYAGEHLVLIGNTTADEADHHMMLLVLSGEKAND